MNDLTGPSSPSGVGTLVGEMLFRLAAVVTVLWNVFFTFIFIAVTTPAVELLMSSRGLAEIDFSLIVGWLSLGLLPALFVAAWAMFGFRRAVTLALGVEAPLVAMALLRLVGARAGTPATHLAFLLGVFGMGVFAIAVIRPSILRRGPSWGPPALLTPTFLVGVWLSLMFALLVPPSVVNLGRELAQVVRYMEPNLSSLAGFGLVTMTLIATLIVPVAVMVLYVSRWRTAIDDSGATGIAASAAVAAGILGTLWFTSAQPQVGVLDRLTAPVDAPSTVAGDVHQWAERVQADDDRLKAGLLAIVLAPYRYLAPKHEMKALARFYTSSGFPEGVGAWAQAIQSALLSPMLYDGPGTDEEQQSARRLYAEIFDGHIEADNREAFRDALVSTWSFRSPSATLVDAASNAVRLKAQTVDVERVGSVADITLHETYVNRTPSDREVLYHFELPESAVVTGLWLGPSSDRAEAFQHRISPRGAAQAVYKGEVRRRVDPALLEQVGPRQYRLRVYPVLAARGRDRLRGGEGPEMHMWIRFRALPVAHRWPLPRLLEARNVFWDRRTTLTVAGEAASRGRGPSGRPRWLPTSLPAPSEAVHHAPIDVAGHTVMVGPASEMPDKVEGPWIVALDTSASMRSWAGDVDAAMARLAEVLPVDTPVVVTRSPALRQAPTVRTLALAEAPFWFGGLSRPEIWRQVRATVPVDGVRGVLIVTDSGTAVQTEERLEAAPTVPLWFLHLGGKPAIAYDDRFIESLQQSGGGVVLSVDDGLRRMAYPDVRQVDGHAIAIRTVSAPAPEGDSSLRPLAAKWLIEAEAPKANGDPHQLDRWHALAKREGIATPYSSMIVLVNPRQHRQLDRAEKAKDRFDREVEGGQTSADVVASDFPSSDLSAVPEPSTWALIGVGLAAVLWRRRALAASVRS